MDRFLGWTSIGEFQQDTCRKLWVSKCVAVNKNLKVKLEINDAVHSFSDLYLRKTTIKNLEDKKREARLFFFARFSYIR